MKDEGFAPPNLRERTRASSHRIIEKDEGGGMKDAGFAPPDLRERTRTFSRRIMRLGDSLPRTRSANVIAYQLIRSGTSVGAHYREGLRSRSDAEVISKLEGALQELEETQYWLELLLEVEIVSEKKLAPLLKETDELIAIFVACVKKVKARGRMKAEGGRMKPER